MPVVKVSDIAFARLQSPDLDVAEEFLTNFGLVRVARTPQALYMRGTGPAHHIHVTHLGEPRFLGLAFHVESRQDLQRLAKAPGAKGIETVDEPGGGQRVRVRDPLGYEMEAIYGMKKLKPLATRAVTRKAGELLRIKPGPSQVKRLGHAVMMTPGAKDKIKWYREMFGFIASDEVYAGPKENIIATFNRCDRGAKHVDHHTFLCFEGEKVGVNHLAFEVQNFDDLMLGNHHLRASGNYEHVWGVGRHILGSQVFDYWKDPWGRVHEHWVDTDRLTARHRKNLIPAEKGLGSQWGDHAPPAIVGHASP